MVALGAVLFAVVLLITSWRHHGSPATIPQEIDPIARLRAPSAEHLLGYRCARTRRRGAARSTAGGYRSWLGWSSALLAERHRTQAIGLVSGYSRIADAVVHAGHGRPDVDPRHPAGDRADVGRQREHF